MKTQSIKPCKWSHEPETAEARRSRLTARRAAQHARESDVLEMQPDEYRQFRKLLATPIKVAGPDGIERRVFRKAPKNPIRRLTRLDLAPNHSRARENERRRRRLAP